MFKRLMIVLISFAISLSLTMSGVIVASSSKDKSLSDKVMIAKEKTNNNKCESDEGPS